MQDARFAIEKILYQRMVGQTGGPLPHLRLGPIITGLAPTVTPGSGRARVEARLGQGRARLQTGLHHRLDWGAAGLAGRGPAGQCGPVREQC